jgi:tetratricopeptide (TPR) repeat protein
MIAATQRRMGAALEFIEKATALAPSRADYVAQQARCLALLHHDEQARAAADRALALGPADALTLDTLGVVFSRLGDHRRAVDLFRAAVAQNPDHAGHAYNLAASLRFLGDFAAAEQAYEDAIRANPRLYRAHSALSGLHRQTRTRNHIERLEGLLAEAIGDVDGELHLRHALAKEYEDLGELSLAFEQLCRGKQRKRAALAYNLDQDRKLFATIERSFGPDTLARASAGDSNPAPIFVIGMPRTGTTLVERILSSHPDVTSAGELQDFALCVKQLAGTPTRRVLDPETVECSATIDPAALGRAYLERTRRFVESSVHFIDKMPLNFLYVGLIHRALPQAKIVCLRRHPMDTCLSNFRQLFAVDFSYYNYAYDLGDIADYYVLFDRLMTHWAQVMPGAMLEVQYESLVAEQERETRRLLEFCGLAWDPRCLAFEANDAPVATASAVQVREKLNSASVGRWRRYGDLLRPVAERLRAAGVRFN